jgi:hypothetical protein
MPPVHRDLLTGTDVDSVADDESLQRHVLLDVILADPTRCFRCK